MSESKDEPPDDDQQPADIPKQHARPVLPYQQDPLFPIPRTYDVYKTGGTTALVLAALPWLAIIGWLVSRIGNPCLVGFCFGILPWLISLTMAGSIAARAPAGVRWRAVLAIVLNMLSLACAMIAAKFIP